MMLKNTYLARINIHQLSALQAVGVLLLVSVLAQCLVGAIGQSPASAAVPSLTQIADTASTDGGSWASPNSVPTNVNYATANQQGGYCSGVLSMNQVETTTGPTQFIYNLDQQLTQIVQPGSVTVTFGYDNAGRPSVITHPLGTVNFGYAPVMGNLSQISSSDGVTITYGYDGPFITDTSWSGLVSGTVHRTFNNNFNISSELINGANLVNYGYDQDGLLTQAGALSANRNAQNGLLTGTALGSVTDTLGYNQFSEITTYTAAYNGSNLLVHANTRDNAGRITQRIEMVSGITHTYVYTYDLAYQLTDVARDGVLLSNYSYSPNSNRTGYLGPNGTITGAYDTQDRLLQYGNLSFSYSPNGELQSKIDTSTGQTTTYVYDAFSNLRSVTLPASTHIDYIIDGQNRRVGKKVNGALVQGLLYSDALEPVAELDGSGNIVSRFVYGTHANVPDYMVKSGQTYFIVSDEVGSPRLVVNITNGQIAQRLDYDEFGNVLTDTNPGFQPFGFAGGIYDRDTGLMRFGARDYDPFVGRWTSKDPILFEGGSANLYAYTDSDPVNWIDPSGLDVWRHGQYKTEKEAAYAALFAAYYDRTSKLLSTGEYCYYQGCVDRNDDGTYYYTLEKDEGSLRWPGQKCGGRPEGIYNTLDGYFDFKSTPPDEHPYDFDTLPIGSLKPDKPLDDNRQNHIHIPPILGPSRVPLLPPSLLVPAVQ